MELPTGILIHNALLGVKGSQGTLLAISPHGYYEINMKFGENLHRVLLPIESTVLISRDAEEIGESHLEVER